MRKKALIFNPYLDTLGGGEFYTFLVGKFLQEKGFNLEIAWLKEGIPREIKRRFNLNFKPGFRINKKAFLILKKRGNFLNKFLFSRNYDLIFFVSDGSIPILFAKENWLLFQAPIKNLNKNQFLDQLKLKKINQVICYSEFVKKYLDEEFSVNARVVYPAVNTAFFNLKPTKKENIILSVGRFDQIMNAKKQDILIKVFKKMVNNGLRNWRLILLGGLIKRTAYFNELNDMLRGYPIEILTNVDFNTLIENYQKAKIYWHAAGFGENLQANPEKAEHFGITIVEAMASGLVPLGFNGGGIPEIIGEKGLLWDSCLELAKKTQDLISNRQLFVSFKKKMEKRSRFFSEKRFFSTLANIF